MSMIDNLSPGHLFCFGMGYSSIWLARRLQKAGWTISGTARSEEKCETLRASDTFRMHCFGEDALQDPKAAFQGVTHILDSIPPSDAGTPSLLKHGEALGAVDSLKWAGYFSTPAVYGDRQGGVAHEDEPPTPESKRGERRLLAETQWLDWGKANAVPSQIFRLAGIYGPGRSLFDTFRQGKARIIDKPGQIFNRIHVDDISNVLIASMVKPRQGGIYNVADGVAAASAEPIRYAAKLLGIDPPEPIPFEEAEMSPMARAFYSECKRLDISRLQEELGVSLRYPGYREGLDAIFAELPNRGE